MRRSRLAVFTCAVFAGLFACAVAASAQEQQQAAAPAPATVASAPARLVVQVEYFKGAPPAYVSVPNGSWFGRFGTTPAAAAPPAAGTVGARGV